MMNAEAASRKEAIVMWNEQKRDRFNELRKPDRQLNSEEQAEVAALAKELEDTEAAYLKPANERLRSKRELLEKQNVQLDRIIERKQALAQRLQRIVAETNAERQAIEHDLATVLADGNKNESDD